MGYQTITRKGNIDSAHRVMDHGSKCFNLHGHTYLYELTFGFDTVDNIGFKIDFADIKAIGVKWLEDAFDHGTILNPNDQTLIRACNIGHDGIPYKLWTMALNNLEYCNPTAENISKEMLLGLREIFKEHDGLAPVHIRLFETTNCFTDCTLKSISEKESDNFLKHRTPYLDNWKKENKDVIAPSLNK